MRRGITIFLLATGAIAGFTIATAAGATLLVLPVGVALAWTLARLRFPGRALVETLRPAYIPTP